MLPQRHDRATVTIDTTRGEVVKRFTDPMRCAREVMFYTAVPWACPTMISHTDDTLTVELLPTAVELADWKPVAATRTLLERLHANHVHHRDVHAKNLVRAADGSPRLIDWETATIRQTTMSYDLHGPDASGIEKPEEHDGYQAQWWDSGATGFALGRWFG